MPIQKRYLGDSVYVELDQFGSLVLTTENGYGPSNTIVLEPEVWSALVAYAGEDEKRAHDLLAQDCKCCLDCCSEPCGAVFAGGPCEGICRCAERERNRDAASVEADDSDSPSGDF